MSSSLRNLRAGKFGEEDEEAGPPRPPMHHSQQGHAGVEMSSPSSHVHKARGSSTEDQNELKERWSSNDDRRKEPEEFSVTKPSPLATNEKQEAGHNLGMHEKATRKKRNKKSRGVNDNLSAGNGPEEYDATKRIPVDEDERKMSGAHSASLQGDQWHRKSRQDKKLPMHTNEEGEHGVQSRMHGNMARQQRSINSGGVDGDLSASLQPPVKTAPNRAAEERPNQGGPDEESIQEPSIPPRPSPQDPLPIAVPVLAQTENDAWDQGNNGPIAVATRYKWFDLSNRRVQIVLLLAILALCVVIGGVVYAVVASSNNNGDSSNLSQTGSPTTSQSPTMSPTTSPYPSATPSRLPTIAPTSLVFEQVGQTLIEDGETPSATGPRGELFFGWSVDLSSNGTRLAASSPYCQCVYIYDFDGSSWIQTAVIKDESGVVDHMVLSGDGTTLAIGIPRNSEVYDIGGKVQAYTESNSSWQKLGDPIFGQADGDRIGGFIDDDRFFGDEYDEDDDATVLSRDSYDSSSLALSDNGRILAIGAQRGNYVKVFYYHNATGQWTKLGTTDFVGEAEGDKFGTTVDLSSSGHTMVVGAPDNLGQAKPSWDIYSGHVRVFQYVQEQNVWIKLGQDLDGDSVTGETAYIIGTEGEQAGSAVSISADGSTIAVSSNFQASSEDIYALGDRDGNVKVFRYAESRDEWIQVGNQINIFQFGISEPTFEETLMLSAGLDSEKFPVVSRLSGDGRRLAISVLAESLGGSFTGRGVVRLYELRGEVWVIIGEPIEGVAAWDHAGRSIALTFDGSRLAIGSPQHNANGVDDGQVRVFDLQGVARGTVGPTSAPSTVAPTATPMPSGLGVPLTIFVTLGYSPEAASWSLDCDGAPVITVPEGSYNGSDFQYANLTATAFVQDGATCHFSPNWDIDAYKVFYGENTTGEALVILDSAQINREIQEDSPFYVSPNTVSIFIQIQTDEFPKENSWSLTCNQVPFVNVLLGETIWIESFEAINMTVMGMVDGVVCEFVIEDSFGDGICCSNGNGTYEIYYGGDLSDGGVLLAAGGQFGSKENVTFVVSPTS